MKIRDVVVNTHNIFTLLFFVLFAVLVAVAVTEGEIWLIVFFGIICLLSVFVFVVSPLGYIFDEKVVTIVYLFGLRETVAWSNISEIYEVGSWFFRIGGTPRYVLCYPKKEKQFFFMVGEISKTRKTTKLINCYYGKL